MPAERASSQGFKVGPTKAENWRPMCQIPARKTRLKHLKSGGCGHTHLARAIRKRLQWKVRAPKDPKIYHITHLDNLPQIVDSVLWSDAERIRRALNRTVVGMSEIKRRRLEELEVECHPGTKVGEYVPFYFCPRSIMLFLLYRGNHPDLTYRGGQSPIVHLEADLRAGV